MIFGRTVQLTATVVDADGRGIPGHSLSFASSDPDVLAVSATGLLTSMGSPGQARITVTSGDLLAGVTAAVVLPPSTILVAPTSLTLHRRHQARILVLLTDEQGERVGGFLGERSCLSPGVPDITCRYA